MPLKVDPTPQLAPGLPDWLYKALEQLSVNPVSTVVPAAGVGEPMVKALGKPISELLGALFSPGEHGTGVPQRLRLTGTTPPDMVQLHSQNMNGQPFEATADQLSQLLDGGALNLTQPPQGAVDKIRRTLASLLGPAAASSSSRATMPGREPLD